MDRFKLRQKPNHSRLLKIVRYGFDCDGTCTDADAERPIYIEAFKKNLLKVLKDKSVFDRLWEPTFKLVSSDLSGNGWIINGKNIAPAHTDGILFCQAIGRVLLLADGMEEADTGNALYKLYKRSYKDTVPQSVFRKGLVGFLNYVAQMSEAGPFVLTNSSTDAVSEKFALLEASLPAGVTIPKMKIIGSAEKFDLDDSLTHVPEYVDLASGKVYCRRGKYMTKLDTLFESADPANTGYVGDSLHLDGVGALTSGRNFFFVPNHETPREEIEYVLAHPNGFVLDSFELM